MNENPRGADHELAYLRAEVEHLRRRLGSEGSLDSRLSDLEARLASTTSSGTWRIPRLVRRTSGGTAYTMVTMVAGTVPMLKKKMNGSM